VRGPSKLERARAEIALLWGRNLKMPVLNPDQARALLMLLNDGTCAGTTLEKDPDPPARVQLIGVGPLHPMPAPGRRRIDLFTGESVFRDGESREYEPYEEAPSFQSVAVLAEDGRCWTLAGAGICWPDWWLAQAEEDAEGATNP
jgi:hypothetical protein